MGLGRGDILGIKVTIDVDGDVDFLHDRIGAFAEPAAPHLVAHDLLLMSCCSCLATHACHRRRPANAVPSPTVIQALHSRI